MPTTSDEFLNNYMSDKNREALGEKVDNIGKRDDNFLAEEVKFKQSFTDDSAIEEERGSGLYATMKQILRASLIIPLLVSALAAVFYMIIIIGPAFLNLLRSIFSGVFGI
jgi:hypothetical protein